MDTDSAQAAIREGGNLIHVLQVVEEIRIIRYPFARTLEVNDIDLQHPPQSAIQDSFRCWGLHTGSNRTRVMYSRMSSHVILEPQRYRCSLSSASALPATASASTRQEQSATGHSHASDTATR